MIMLRIYRINPELASQIQGKLDIVNYLQAGPKMVFTEDDLTIINDALYKIQPGQKRCVGGTFGYGQTVNFDDTDDSILVQSGIFQALSATHEAALMMHEAVYAHLRKAMGDKDSVRARRVVGLLFSTLSQDDLKKALEDVLGGGAMNSVGMSFVPIQPGSFMMGSPASEAGRYADEVQHLVTISRGFEMQATDVTQAQYAQVMGANPSAYQKPENCPKNFKVVYQVAMCPNNPVENVSFNDAQLFISKLNSAQTNGHYYRLPTEAEWEYAARAGTSTAYSFGDDPNQLALYSWFNGNAGGQTHEVGQLKANAFGLYDMQGNVWQWVQDLYGEYGASAATDPNPELFYPVTLDPV